MLNSPFGPFSLSHLFNRFIVILAYALIFQSPMLMSRTFYISPNGDDDLDGKTPQTAWQSVSILNLIIFNPGDSILLEGGKVHNGNLIFEGYEKTLEVAPLYIGSYGEGKATLFAGKGNGIYIHNSGGIQIENINIQGEGRDKNDRHGILCYIDKPLSRPYKKFDFTYLEVSGFNKGGITFYADPKSNFGFSDIEINQCITHHNGDHGIAISGKVKEIGHTNSDIYIGHSQAFKNYGEIGKDHAHTGNGIVVGNSSQVLIEYCQAWENGKDNRFDGGGPVGVWLWDCYQGLIQFCESHHNKTASEADGGGFDLDGGCQDCCLQYNYSHDNEGAGLMLAEYDGAKPLYNNTIRQNISINDGLKNNYGSLFFWRGDGSLTDARIYENLILSRESSTGFMVVSDSIANLEVVNNFFITDGKADLVNLLDSVENLVFKDNHFFSQSGKYTYRSHDSVFSSMDGWTRSALAGPTPGKHARRFFYPNNDNFWKSILTLMVGHSNPELKSRLDWDQLFKSPLPRPMATPLRFDVYRWAKNRFPIFWKFAPNVKIKELIIERKRDFDPDYQVVTTFFEPHREAYYVDYNHYSGETFYRLRLKGEESAYGYSTFRRCGPETVISDLEVLKIPYGFKLIFPENYLSIRFAELIDAGGKTVQQWKGVEKSLVDLPLNAPIKKGIYVLKLVGKKQEFVRKIIID